MKHSAFGVVALLLLLLIVVVVVVAITVRLIRAGGAQANLLAPEMTGTAADAERDQ